MKTLASTLAIAALLGWFGPALDDHGAEHAVAADLEQAQRDAAAQARFEKAVQAVCGENAGWTDLGNGSVQCFTHRGHKTVIAGVQP